MTWGNRLDRYASVNLTTIRDGVAEACRTGLSREGLARDSFGGYSPCRLSERSSSL